MLKEVDFLSTVSGGGYTGTFLTRMLGRGAPQYRHIRVRMAPIRRPIRYVRQHAKYLSAYDLKKRWGNGHRDIRRHGPQLDSIPLLVLTLASLATVFIPAENIPWTAVLIGSSAVTVVCLAIYALGMHSAPAPRRRLARLVCGHYAVS